MGFVGSRVLEAATIFVGVVSLLSVVTLRQAAVGADALVTSQALVAVNNWIFLLGRSFLPVPLATGVCADGDRRSPDRAVGVLAGPLAGRKRLQALTHHRWKGSRRPPRKKMIMAPSEAVHGPRSLPSDRFSIRTA